MKQLNIVLPLKVIKTAKSAAKQSGMLLKVWIERAILKQAGEQAQGGK